MAKFNKAAQMVRGSAGPVRTTGIVATTFEGGPAWSRDAKSDLFLLAVTSMVGEDTFYEGASERDERFRQLAGQVALDDADWTSRFIPWLRAEAGMRSASLVAAAEAVRARLAAGMAGHNRQLISAACQRADEPGELIGYWTSRYGRALPQPVKRGLADAAARLYSERSLLKYDSEASGFRFGDVIDLVHPVPRQPWQGELFSCALDRRHGRDKPIPEVLGTLRARETLMAVPPEQRRTVLRQDGAVQRLADAGITWEALAGWLQGPMDAEAWQAVAPSMGVFALIRNLRNFDQAGLSDEAAQQVAARISDPDVISRSRLFPYRFLSAYRAAPSLRWGQPLERALELATGAVPALPGRTLILVDTSSSMRRPVSMRSAVTHADIGALTGVALARRGCAVELVGFADGMFRHRLARGGSMLRAMDAFTRRIGEVGHGTRIVESLRASYDRQDRVIIVSDMQTFAPWGGGRATVSDVVPARVPVFGINTTGYAPSALNTAVPGRYEIGGFSDKVFTMLGLLAGGSTAWPF
jgi:TROVE domain